MTDLSTLLFSPIRAGSLELSNRVVMAPLTRNRADDITGEVGDIHAIYYHQRASAGLIITEATQISAQGKGYISTPGIYTDQQVEAWRKVTEAVHSAGGRIVLQLWHVGRISHVSILPNGESPVAPSAIRANAETYTHEGFAQVSEPRALLAEEIPDIVADYRNVAQNAIKAGFDGVEIHSANGYLLDQFLKDGTNKRTDGYGGTIENRARFLLEVVDAISSEIGAGRTGVRLSPFSDANDAHDSNPLDSFGYVLRSLNPYGLAYLHMVEGQTGGPRSGMYDELRKLWDGIYIGNNGYDRDLAINRVAGGQIDAAAFGRPWIANPDLVERLIKNATLNEADHETMYGGGEAGYIDYPTLNRQSTD